LAGELKAELGGASNSWAIHGNHTKSGKPILSNDPHLGNGMPSVWYLASVLWDEGKDTENYLIGAFLPGVPFSSAGKSKYIGFAVTINPADTSDLFEEKIEGDKYLFKEKWLPLNVRREVI
jgi:penicillin amidase